MGSQPLRLFGQRPGRITPSGVFPLLRPRKSPIPCWLFRRYNRHMGVAAVPAVFHCDSIQYRVLLVESRYRRTYARLQGRRADGAMDTVRRFFSNSAFAQCVQRILRERAVAIQTGNGGCNAAGAAPATPDASLSVHDEPPVLGVGYPARPAALLPASEPRRGLRVRKRVLFRQRASGCAGHDAASARPECSSDGRLASRWPMV